MAASEADPSSRLASARRRLLQPSYGAILLAAAMVTLGYQGAVFGSRTFLVVAIPEENGWSRAATASAVSGLTLGGGIWAPVLGILLQRWGPRGVMTVAGLLYGLGLMSAGYAQDPFQLWLVLLLLVSSGSVGIGSLANFAAIQSQFKERRGFAMALADSGTSLGMMTVMPAIQILIVGIGWRSAYLLVGMVALLLAPLHWLVQRSSRGVRSQEPGVRRDQASSAQTPTEPIWRRLLSGRFWLVAGGMSCIWFTQQTVGTHQAAYLSDHGFDAPTIAASYALMGLAGLFGRPAYGWLSDRYGRTPVFGMLTAGMMLGIGGLVLAAETKIAAALWGYCIVLGASLGVGTLLFARQVSVLFGERSFGSVMGLVYLFASGTGAGGATAAGYVFDVIGTYLPSFAAAEVGAVISFLCVWQLGRIARSLPARS